MTIDEYWHMFDLVRGNVEGALASHIAYLKIHNLGATDERVLEKYNRTPEFWRLSTHALQQTFFIAYGRIFDKRKDAYSIHDLIGATIEHVGFFSKKSLRERKSAFHESWKWIEDYMATACEPSRKDFELLGAAIAPHAEKFKLVYQPIRHSYVAHRGNISDKEIHELFAETNIGDVKESLKLLYTLIWAIREIYNNGTKIDLRDTGEYDRYVRDLETDVEKLVGSLP